MLPSTLQTLMINGLFVNSSDNNIYSFTYLSGVFTGTSMVTNFGTVSPQSIFTNNANFTKLIVVGPSKM